MSRKANTVKWFINRHGVAAPESSLDAGSNNDNIPAQMDGEIALHFLDLPENETPEQQSITDALAKWSLRDFALAEKPEKSTDKPE